MTLWSAVSCNKSVELLIKQEEEEEESSYATKNMGEENYFLKMVIQKIFPYKTSLITVPKIIDGDFITFSGLHVPRIFKDKAGDPHSSREMGHATY